MQRSSVRTRSSFVALTVSRKGRLLKNHLADPNVGLSHDLQRIQETPVSVVLRPIRVVSDAEVRTASQCECFSSSKEIDDVP